MRTPFEGPAPHSYLAGPPRQVPGFESLHRMTRQLLREGTGPSGTILVLGAGGGLELKALAAAEPGWRFEGVDPSAEMLALARDTASEAMDRILLVEGRIGEASSGPFDGATALLVFHFVPEAERLATLRALRERLRPGAALVTAHLSVPRDSSDRARWLARHVAYGRGETGDTAGLAASVETLRERLTLLSPEEEIASFEAAGFVRVERFYQGLAISGFVGFAP